MINNVLTNTNWATYKDNIYPMASGVNSLEQIIGENELLWYYDSDFTRLVGEDDIINPETEYFAKIGPSYLESVKGFNCSITVQNASDLTVYNESDRIPLGTKLKITINPNSGYSFYSANINGNSVEAPNNVIQTIFEGNMKIVLFCWDGVNAPLSPVLEENTWEQIAIGIKTRAGYDIGWKIGDTKRTTFADGNTYTLRLIDTHENKYEFSDGSGYTNGVFETVEVMPEQLLLEPNLNYNNQYVVVADYWDKWNASKQLREKVNVLPNELKNIIKEVNFPIMYETPSYIVKSYSSLCLNIMNHADSRPENPIALEYYRKYLAYNSTDKDPSKIIKYDLTGTASEWAIIPDITYGEIGTKVYTTEYIGANGTLYGGRGIGSMNYAILFAI
jgi:hypothetical protein